MVFTRGLASGLTAVLVLKIHVVGWNGRPGGFLLGLWPGLVGTAVVVLVVAHILAIVVAVVGVKAEILPGSRRRILLRLFGGSFAQDLVCLAE